MDSIPPIQTQKRSWHSTAGWIILVIVGLLILPGIMKKFSRSGSSSYHPSGKTTYLDSGSRYVNVAVSKSACKEMEDAYSDLHQYGLENTQERLKRLMLSGLVFLADSHSRVVVLESGFSRAKVRIVSGNQSGQIGWVPIGFLSSQ